MSRQVYIGKVKSDTFDYYIDDNDNRLPERISDDKSNYVLWNGIYGDVLHHKIPNSKIAGYECNVIKLNKADLLKYLSKPEYRQRPKCFSYLDKEIYEKHRAEEIDYLISVANGLSEQDEYLLVAYEATSLEEWEAEEIYG